MNSDKTLILMDTNKTRNILDGSPRYDEFDFGRDFKVLKLFIDKNNLSDNIILAITEMTLKELLVQKKKTYEDDKENLRSASTRLRTLKNVVVIPDFTLPDNSFDCVNYLDPIINEFLKENNITIIKVEDSKKSSTFDALIQRAIDRKPPFKPGKNNNFGSGFKDAIIWETFSQNDIKKSCDNIILFTNDNDFNGCEKEINDVNFKIIKSTGELIDELESIYDTQIRIKKYEKILENQYFENNLKHNIELELDHTIDDINIVSLRDQIIDDPIDLKEKFHSLNKNEEYFENMICLVSNIRILDDEYIIYSLIDLGPNTIITIQVENNP